MQSQRGRGERGKMGTEANVFLAEDDGKSKWVA